VIQPKTSDARNGDVNVACQVIGDGPLDLLFIPAFVSQASDINNSIACGGRRCMVCRPIRGRLLRRCR
jgi:hypothetical protein